VPQQNLFIFRFGNKNIEYLLPSIDLLGLTLIWEDRRELLLRNLAFAGTYGVRDRSGRSFIAGRNAKKSFNRRLPGNGLKENGKRCLQRWKSSALWTEAQRLAIEMAGIRTTGISSAVYFEVSLFETRRMQSGNQLWLSLLW